jgi:hypothetical protein
MGNPCNEEDMDLFYASINLTIGNGKAASFLHSPWIEGTKPKYIAPAIFNISKWKSFVVS